MRRVVRVTPLEAGFSVASSCVHRWSWRHTQCFPLGRPLVAPRWERSPARAQARRRRTGRYRSEAMPRPRQATPSPEACSRREGPPWHTAAGLHGREALCLGALGTLLPLGVDRAVESAVAQRAQPLLGPARRAALAKACVLHDVMRGARRLVLRERAVDERRLDRLLQRRPLVTEHL